MAEIDSLDDFDDQVAALEGSLQAATTLAAGFAAELERVGAGFADVNADAASLSSDMARGLRKSIDGVVYGSMSLTDALKSLGTSMLDSVYDTALAPVTDHLGSILGQGLASVMNGLTPFAQGGAFAQGRVSAFANGGIVSGATTFPMRGGIGLMGEAGPEAIMPLTRGPNGKLGVRAEGGGRAVNITMNISTPDVAGFQRSQGQIAAQVTRALGRGQRYS